MNASGITRKDFIKSSALAVAGLAISPSLLAASPFNLTNDKTLKGAKI